MTFYLVFIFLLFSQFVQSESSQDEDPDHVTTVSPIKARIVNGTEAEVGRWPFVVSIQEKARGSDKYEFSGRGTILNDDTILTLIWCILNEDKATEAQVVIGQVNKSNPDPKYVYNVTKYIQAENDIGLVKLARKIDFKDMNVSKICLPSPDDEPVLDKCIAIEWGLTWHPPNETGDSPDLLRQVDLPIRTLDECPNGGGLYDDKFFYCAGFYDGSKSTCFGDGGGPLMCFSKSDSNVLLQFGIADSAEISCASYCYFAKTAPNLDRIMKKAED